MGKDSDIDYGKIVHYVLIALVAGALLWLNYCNFQEHISSNKALINNYSPKEDEMAKYRNPVVAGLFYPSDAQSLSEDIDNYLKTENRISNYQPQILIVPHAGYQYSATAAAKAYASLRNFSDKIRNVILVGPSHRVAFDGIAAPSVDYFKTPLGSIALNREIVQEMHNSFGIKILDKAHAQEHSLEVQLPFLQKVLKKFKIIPLVYGNVSSEKLAEVLNPYLHREDTVIVISADLSHYYDYETAKALDKITADLVARNEADIDEHQSCGAIGINAALILAKENNFRPEMLDMINSGDTAGDKDSVVGYGAWRFEKKQGEEPQTELEKEVANLKLFSENYGETLLNIAEQSVSKAVIEHHKYSPSRDDYDDVLFDKGAAFVTLTDKNGELRGCIGTIVPNQGIAKDVASNAYRAAIEDSRFHPVSETELEGLNISISLLSGFERIRYMDEADLLTKINQVVDGIIIRDGNRQGVFLPSVWQQLPEKQEFLNNLKVKAGISPSYWSNKIKVYRFRTVEIKKDEN